MKNPSGIVYFNFAGYITTLFAYVYVATYRSSLLDQYIHAIHS